MNSLLKPLLWIALAMLAATGCVTGQTSAPKKVLLIAGKPSHPPGMHEFRAGMMLFQKSLENIPGLTVLVASNGWPTRMEGDKRVDDPTAFEGVDAVVIYADGGGGHPALQGNRTQLFDALARKGVGLGFAHYGVEVPKGEPGEAMHRWVGGYYEHLFSVNPMWKPEFKTLPKHAVTEGVKPFATHDEWYFNMRWVPGQKGVTPILVATADEKVRRGPYVYPRGPYDHIIADAGRAETMMWVCEREDGGRGFGFTGGHTHNNWTDANQRKVLLNAVLWIARMKIPAGGVESSLTEADFIANQDPKK